MNVAPAPRPSTLHSAPAPWYRQFWPWFLIALPLASVVLSFFTLSMAIRHADVVLRTDEAIAQDRPASKDAAVRLESRH